MPPRLHGQPRLIGQPRDQHTGPRRLVRCWQAAMYLHHCVGPMRRKHAWGPPCCTSLQHAMRCGLPLLHPEGRPAPSGLPRLSSHPRTRSNAHRQLRQERAWGQGAPRVPGSCTPSQCRRGAEALITKSSTNIHEQYQQAVLRPTSAPHPAQTSAAPHSCNKNGAIKNCNKTIPRTPPEPVTTDPQAFRVSQATETGLAAQAEPTQAGCMRALWAGAAQWTLTQPRAGA
jgi:hypothetical protein